MQFIIPSTIVFVAGFIYGLILQRRCFRMELERYAKEVETSTVITEAERKGCRMAIEDVSGFASVKNGKPKP